MKPVLAHVITGLNTGGAEMMLASVLEHHERSRFQPVVYCLTDDGPVADRIRALGIPVRNLGMRKGMPDPLVVARLAWDLRRRRAVVVQTWLYHADLIGGLAARLARMPIAWGIHNSRLDGNAAGRGLRAVIIACRWLSPAIPSRIICVAESAKTAHVEMGYPAARMTVIPNGFDLDQFRPNPAARGRIRAELGIAGEAPVIGIAGRFVPLKNHRPFVEAARIVAERCPEARFLMAGDGVDRENADLMRWIEVTGYADRFYLLGRRSDMADVLAATDIVALTSNTEAFPLVVGEAMATGVPCVSTDVGDAGWLIGETGRVVPRDDPERFAEALLDLLGMDAGERQELGCRARRRMEQEFEIGHVAARYDALWHALATGADLCA
jgi:glycosyltransferase involved in cell wall biosynthesis